MAPTAQKLDPVTLSLINAPEDDEEEAEEESLAVEQSKDSLRRGEPTTSLEDFAQQMGISVASTSR
jgi:hypothetical protein